MQCYMKTRQEDGQDKTNWRKTVAQDIQELAWNGME